MWRRLRAVGVAAAVCLVAALTAAAPHAAAQADTAQAADNVPATPPPPAPGTSPALDSARAARGARLVVTLYTYGPGTMVFEKFGHVALAVRDSATGEDIAFNWGMFDFNQPNFLSRFLTGDTRYWMAGYRTADFNAAYQGENRSIRAQQLALSPMQRGAIADYVTWNADTLNRYYRYDYYNDNCSTRVRNVLDWATGGQLRPLWSVPGTGRTWRGETARITADDAPTYAGIQVALGRQADRSLMPWEEAFLPEYLAQHLASAEILDGAGNRVRMVAHDTVLFTADRAPMPSGPPTRVFLAAALGIALAAMLLALARGDGGLARAGAATITALWLTLGGIVGTLLLLAGTVTKHAPYMGQNTTLLQLHPLLLIAAVVVTIALVRHRAGAAARGLAAVVALCAVVGAVMLFVPGWQQTSGVVVGVTLPVHLALAVSVWRLPRTIAATRS